MSDFEKRHKMNIIHNIELVLADLRIPFAYSRKELEAMTINQLETVFNHLESLER